MKILQIDVACNVTSTGRIAEGIGGEILSAGGESYIAYGRCGAESRSVSFRIGNGFDVILHGVYTRLFDRHGFGSRKATENLIKRIDEIKPDIIHLHDIHGYYLNIDVLFQYIAAKKIPVVWSQHSCWAFTGHCAHFEYVKCDKWKRECHHCIQKTEYPASLMVDNSRKNFQRKKQLFTNVPSMSVVTVSTWLEKLARQSFLSKYPIKTIYNGIDVEAFLSRPNNVKEQHGIEGKFLIVGVACPWTERKGIADFITLRSLCGNDVAIMMVGLDRGQMASLPQGIIKVEKTDSVEELARIYSAADLFFNPTWEDTFPTTNMESLACGTPVATYNTGGSGEALSEDTGFVLEQGSVEGVLSIIDKIRSLDANHYAPRCRARALNHFRQKDRFNEYIGMYKSILAGRAEQ